MPYYFIGDDDGGQGDEDFGSTADLHESLMGFLWSPAANIAIFLIIYAYRKYWVWLHMLFFTFAIIITLSTSLPILAHTGLIPANSTKTYDDFSAATMRIHYILGIVCCIAAGLVSLLGILTKLLNVCNARSTVILIMRRIHTWTGYIAVLSCKGNIYVLGDDVAIYIVIDIVSIILYVFWRIFFPKLQARGVTPKYEESIPSIKSVRQLDNNKSYIIFANNVYDAKPLRYNHPAGYQIINVLKNKEVDRYIYGSCLADQLPDVRMWSHSYKSFTLMGTPVAKIDIMPTFQGFDSPQIQCNLPELITISQKGGIYQMNLTKRSGNFKFLKYRFVTQLGRYYGLTLNDKVTRLYTTVNFLVQENTDFLATQLTMYPLWKRQIQTRKVTGKTAKIELSEVRKNMQVEVAPPSSDRMGVNTPIPGLANRYSLTQKNNYVPIMFKSYKGGKFSQGIVKGTVQKLMLSCSKGEGLQLSHTQPGKIILVAGGTGIYPFSDFIDLLYKEQLMIQRPQTRSKVLDVSPILDYNPFENYTFELFAAFAHVEDMHVITLEQLLYLATVGRLKITFKFREDPSTKIQEGPNITFTKTGFQDLLESSIDKGGVSRVWICGPPGMNIMVSKALRQKYDNPDLYLIV